jgi:hypothetical protein
MLVTYSQEDGLAKAAMDTFSGEKPCGMCDKIADAKREDGKKQGPGSNEVITSVRIVHDLFPTEEIAVQPLMAMEWAVATPLPPNPSKGLGIGSPLLQPPRLLS